MAQPADKAKVSNSGIRQLSNGQAIIPASTRADGTVRKEIRVKPGYKPREDVEIYKTRTLQEWKNRGDGGVPGAEVAQEKDTPLQSAAANKNTKRREARRRAAEAAQAAGAKEQQAPAEENLKKREEEEAPGVDPEAEKLKEARKLAKKVRQARELKDKKDGGDNLLPEQLAKLIKLNELIRQLDALGFDANAEKKVHVGEGAEEKHEGQA